MAATSKSSSNDAFALKVVLCGVKGVGKTALYNRLKEDRFYDKESQTMTNDQCIISVPCGSNDEVKINLWDTVGMEDYDSLTRSYFHKSVFVIIVYSADIKSSVSVVADYVAIAKEHAPGRAKLVLVQNKIDLPESPEKSESETLSKLKSDFKFKFEFKISAKTGQGTKEMMKKLAAYYKKNNKDHKKCASGIRLSGGDDHRHKCCSRK